MKNHLNILLFPFITRDTFYIKLNLEIISHPVRNKNKFKAFGDSNFLKLGLY